MELTSDSDKIFEVNDIFTPVPDILNTPNVTDMLLFAMNMNDYATNESITQDKDPLWMVLMDRSQLIMTIIGFLANVATSITLIKNGQVSNKIFYSLC